MKFKMKNDSWFGHLALCIVLRHCVAVFRRDEWLWDILRRSSYLLYKIWREAELGGVATYKRHLYFLVFSRYAGRWNPEHNPQTRLHDPQHGSFCGRKGSSLLRCHLLEWCSFNARALSVGARQVRPRHPVSRGDAMEHEWHWYGIWCVTPTGVAVHRIFVDHQQ